MYTTLQHNNKEVDISANFSANKSHTSVTKQCPSNVGVCAKKVHH